MMFDKEREYEPPVVRDKRRIDPTTGAVRPDVPSAARPAPPGAARPGDEASSLGDSAVAAELAERTADLQRLQAEYVNYRRRVERDRDMRPRPDRVPDRAQVRALDRPEQRLVVSPIPRTEERPMLEEMRRAGRIDRIAHRTDIREAREHNPCAVRH